MRIGPIAFDLDGTLIGCRERQVALAAAVVRELGAGELDENAFWARKRRGDTTRAALLGLGLDDALAAEAAARWAARVEEPEWLALDPVLPDARPALELAADGGPAPIILTARRDPAAVCAQLAGLALDALVSDVIVVSPDDAAEAKAKALRERQVSGYLGDTESDARAAAIAGVPFAAVACGQRDRNFLDAHGIHPVYSSALAAVRALTARA